jgi:NDP-sugar pyrophosphorylase family protein
MMPLVFYGDLYTDLDIGGLIAAHRRAEPWITMALYQVDNPTMCGIVELDERHRVVRFVEKPRPDEVFSRMANAGVFVVEPQVLDLIPPEMPCDFGHDIFPKMLENGLPIYEYLVQELLIDIGTLENYQRALHIAAERERDEGHGHRL